MAINYEPVGWDTTKHFNPTNMNHMDGGIKAACDKVDEHDSEIAEINSNLKHGVCNLIGFSTEMLKKTIYFDTPFETTPNVVISPTYVEYEGGDNLFKYIALDSITTESFTIVYKANSISDSWPWNVNWIAMA